MTTAPRAVARVEHSEALLRALRQRVHELKLTHEIVDHRSGFQSGYSSKLLSDPPQRRLGHFSLFVLLQTLGLDMVLVENPQALESLMNPMHLRRQKWILRAPRIVVLTPDRMRVNGAKGGYARAKKLMPIERSEISRKAVMTRWANAKARQISKGG